MRQLLALTTAPLVLLTLATGPLVAQTGGRDDHPMVSRYSGSELIDKTFEEFGSYMLATGIDTKAGGADWLKGRKLEGRVTRFVYQNPARRSPLEIFRNYQRALTAAGLKPVWTCTKAECGPTYGLSTWGRFNGMAQAATGGDPHYLAGSIRNRDGTAWVAVMIGKHRHQVDIVELVGMEEGMVIADANALASGLEKDGRVTVPGIYFDIDKSIVKPESKDALDQVAALLRDKQDLRVFVVGHTDMTGDLGHNRTLSDARARAVVEVLVTQYRIARARLDGYGVGPLSPAASNGTEAGRRINRRVELVQRAP